MMPFIYQNSLIVVLMMAIITFFAKFWPIWVENQRNITENRLKKRVLETKLVMFPLPEWCGFDDQTLYSVCDFDNKFITLLYKSPTPMGVPQTFNGNFVTHFYQGNYDRW